MKVRVEHTIELPADDFFERIYFNEEFNARLFESLGFQERTVLEEVDRGDTIYRRVRQVPKRDIPEPFKKALGGASLGFEEQSCYSKAARRAEITVIPAIQPDKVKVHGTFWIEPDGPDRCKRLFEVEVKVGVFGVGTTVERLIVADIVKSHDKSAEFTNAWLRTLRPGGPA